MRELGAKRQFPENYRCCRKFEQTSTVRETESVVKNLPTKQTNTQPSDTFYEINRLENEKVRNIFYKIV